MNNFENLTALFINGTLKPSPEVSHTQGLMDVSKKIMEKEGVSVDTLRIVDHHIASGIQPDMTQHGFDQDEWPAIWEKVLKADILIIGSPIWLGERSSQCSMLIERLYAMSGETNHKGQSIFYGKVGGCVITGNEDGIKHCAQSILYALQHLGYSIPPQADCGWIGEVGPGPSYLDPESNAEHNDFTNRNTTFMTYNILHLANMLKKYDGYPKLGNSRKKWNEGERWGFSNPEYRWFAQSYQAEQAGMNS